MFEYCEEYGLPHEVTQSFEKLRRPLFPCLRQYEHRSGVVRVLIPRAPLLDASKWGCYTIADVERDLEEDNTWNWHMVEIDYKFLRYKFY